MKPNQGHSGQ